MTPIVVDGLTKRLGDTLAVNGVSLEIEAGELFFLLGPSGCGKTTLLSLVAGLLEPDSGRVLFGGRDVTREPTRARSAVMCFQSYALWPHLSVSDNVAFGLATRGVEPRERRRRVDEALELVQMSGYGDRKPAELSGGQQQRVAIARAVVVRPACLLLDEPLSNLDTRLRHQMRNEIRRICRSTGLTTLYVTHDQKEALSVADRIAIMNQGSAVQVGTPEQLYRHPRTTFVAEFLGQSNLVPATIVGRAPEGGPHGARLHLETELGRLEAPLPDQSSSDDERVIVAIRPEQVRIVPVPQIDAGAPNRFGARLLSTSFLGDSSEHELAVGSTSLRAISVPARLDLPESVAVELPYESLVVLER